MEEKIEQSGKPMSFSCILISLIFPLCMSYLLPSFVRHETKILGITEWRDIILDDAENHAGQGRRKMQNLEEPLRSICILPFPCEELLLIGQTKQLRLYEDRFIELFDDVMENHEGVVAMGLIAASGIIKTVPLCEVEAYNRMEGFGIFVTIRAVGRASLTDVTKQDPYIKAMCYELTDKHPPDLKKANLIADTIEDAMVTLSALEHKLETLMDKPDSEVDEEMERRIKIAKLDDKFFADDFDDEDDNNDIEEDRLFDRRRRYHQAYRIVLDIDTQGYVLRSQEVDTETFRSLKELSAVSWAAFMTEILPEEDAIFRIQALDESEVLKRLALASYMLRQKRVKLQSKIDRYDAKRKENDDDRLS
jgi:hypothetical protein